MRVRWLGKKGSLTEQLKGSGKLADAERKECGRAHQRVREESQSHRGEACRARAGALSAQARAGRIDVTLPGRGEARGGLHPVTRAAAHRADLRQAGFEVATGPEVEDDFHNFEALNIPADHPARAMHDTFYFPDGKLLRTHTSPVQIRTMLRGQAADRGDRARARVSQRSRRHALADVPPGRRPGGRRGRQLRELKGMLHGFLAAFFGATSKMRLRPSYFPFTEPSAEMDMSCVFCGGAGCRVCKHTGWLEIVGCGMVHPNVLEAGGIDPEKYTGFAFGMGIERLAMLRYGVDDMRLFFENDLRFLAQFRAGRHEST